MNDMIWKIAIGFSYIILNILLELSSSNKFDGQLQKIEYNTYVLQMTDQWPPHPIKQVLHTITTTFLFSFKVLQSLNDLLSLNHNVLIVLLVMIPLFNMFFVLWLKMCITAAVITAS